MTPPRKTGSFAEFERHVLQATSKESFQSHFAELSHNADRSGMINLILEILKDYKVPMPDFYRKKDLEKAAELLKKPERTAAILTEALTAAPVKSKLFFEALAKRAKFSYSEGSLTRCFNDCRYFADVAATVSDLSDVEESRIDMLLLLSDCCKAMAMQDESRNLLNEAMKRINDLASKLCGNEDEKSDVFRAKKLELLKSFLLSKPILGEKQSENAESNNNNKQEEKEVPKLEGKAHQFLRNCSDTLALGHDKIKGRFLYATKNIKPGSVLIVDKPFSYSTDIFALPTNCTNCHTSFRLDGSIKVPCADCQAVHFCSEKCRQQAWSKFHKYECRVFDHFYKRRLQRTNSLLAYRTVVTAAFNTQENTFKINEEFLRLHENDKTTLDIKSLKKYEPHDYKTVFALETHCAQSDPKDNLERVLHSVFLAKCLIHSLKNLHPEVKDHERHLHVLAVALLHSMQAINCNAYEIVENVRDDETKVLEPRNVGGAIYTSVSLTNHSCYPNTVRHSFPCGTVVVTSLRFIPEGGEILDCYGQHFLENDRDTRRRLLAHKYFFDCQCEPCTFDWPIKLPNDQFNFKCKNCSKQCRRTRTAAECTSCGQKMEISKLYTALQNSIKKRLSALTKMYDDNYRDALPLLLEHANCIDKILSEPSLEAVKTQQSIIQCLNALSCTSV